MTDPMPKSATFAEDLARAVLEHFSGPYYVGTEYQREKIITGAGQFVACRLKQLDEAQSPK
jgi:hypothetical protein